MLPVITLSLTKRGSPSCRFVLLGFLLFEKPVIEEVGCLRLSVFAQSLKRSAVCVLISVFAISIVQFGVAVFPIAFLSVDMHKLEIHSSLLLGLVQDALDVVPHLAYGSVLRPFS